VLSVDDPMYVQPDGPVKRAIQAASFSEIIRFKYLLRLQQYVCGPSGESLMSLLPYGAHCLLSSTPEDMPAALAWMDHLGLQMNKQLLLALSEPS
jgi:hypothetical protein